MAIQKSIFILLGVGFLASSCTSRVNFPDKSEQPDGSEVVSVIADDTLKQRMADNAFESFFSTAPNYVVIIATNDLTGETREICTESSFVLGALEKNRNHTPYEFNWDDFIKQRTRSFTFNSRDALELIGFDEYSDAERMQFAQRQEVKNIISDVLSADYPVEHIFRGSYKEQLMFAHVLFDNGIMSSRGCIARNIMVLEDAR